MRLILALAASLLVAGCGRAQGNGAAAAPPPGKAVTLALVAPRNAAKITVSSAAVGPDGAFARSYSNYGDNTSPPLSWTPVAGAVSYAFVLEDPDAPGEAPFIHWAIWNIPATATSLPAGITGGPKATAPGNAIQGLNGVGDVGYFGPRPPAGTGAHHYHLQVFALDAPLGLASGAQLGDLKAAMKGHVLADGELVATMAAASAPAAPAAPAAP